MKSHQIDQEQDFITRQYASLIADGMNADTARAHLGEVLGEPALQFLETEAAGEEPAKAAIASRLAQVTKGLGGSAPDTRAACMRSVAEARLFALDWWRPIRTFLLYIIFLLALAAGMAAFFLTVVLPDFRTFGQNMNIHDGAAAWIMSDGAIRLFGPLVVIAILLVILAAVWFWMRLRIAGLKPLAGMTRFPWMYGRSGAEYRAMLCLEYASILHEGGAPRASIMDAALRLIRWPTGKLFQTREGPTGAQLEQARKLGTLEDELDWQRRLCWSNAQSRLEMSRDRLILLSRVIFYLLIGYMVTVLYLPVFSLATAVGAQF